MPINKAKLLLFTLAIAGTAAAYAVSAVDDITPPSTISDLAPVSTHHDHADLQWTAPGDDGIIGTASFYDMRHRMSGPIDEVNFATSTAVAGEPSPHASGAIETFTVTGLTPSTTYWFALRTTDDAGNTSALSNIAATTTPTDTSAPALTGVSVSNITVHSARVTWTTNEAASSRVEWGTTSAYGSHTASSTLVTSHTLDLVSLLPSTLYHFIVSSADTHGNTATSSDAVFITLATSTPDAAPPVISGISITDITTASATVRWNTNEPANSLVRYGTTTAYGLNVNNTSLVTAHALPLFSLIPATLYHFAVSSADAAGNTATSSDHVFTTRATSTPATTTIQARVQMEPHTINRVRKGKKITAVVRLPQGVTFEGLDVQSVLLNGTVKPIDLKPRKKEWNRWGRYRRTLILKFASDDLLPLIPTSTDQFTFTVTGTVTAGQFQGSDTVRVIPKPQKQKSPERIEKKIETIEYRMEKARERLEEKKEELEKKQEKIKEQFEKKQERLKDKIERIKEKFK